MTTPRNRYLLGNWKMNINSSKEVEGFFKTVTEQSDSFAEKNQFYWGIAPQNVFLSGVAEATQSFDQSFMLGAQNIGFSESGAFTGEVSPTALESLGVRFTLIGHSERRTLFKEDNSLLSQRLRFTLEHSSIFAVFCVGETLDEREADQTKSVIERQLSILSEINAQYLNADRLCIAYEPVWAIGTGKTATPEQAQEIHQYIRSQLAEISNKLESCAILYGGSVKPSNVESLISKDDIDGALVGGASLEADSFAQLATAF